MRQEFVPGTLFRAPNECKSAILAGERAEADEDRGADGMGAVNGSKVSRHTVGCKLPAKGGGEARNDIEIVVIAKGIGLDLADRLFDEAGRQRIFAEDEFV